MRPRIVIHIGAPKTGSTSVQRAIRADAELWRAHGLLMPVLPEMQQQAGNAALLAASLGAETAGLRRSHPEIDIASLDPSDLIARMFADWRRGEEVLLLSAVHLGAAQAEPLRELLPHDVDYTVVFVVRNQFRWLESYHRQLVKTMLFHGGVSELVPAVLDANGPRYCPDWLHTYEAWHDAFDNCQVILFEEAVPDLLGAFTAAAGIAIPPELGAAERQNVSPDAYEVAYLLALGAELELPDFRLRRTAASTAATKLSLPSLRFLTAEDRERLRERFEPGNRTLLEILGRPYESSPLDLSDTDSEHAALTDVYGSESYEHYREVADSQYAKLTRHV